MCRDAFLTDHATTLNRSVSPLAPDIDMVAKNSLLMHAVLRQDRN